MADDELSKIADQVFEKLKSRFHALDGVVGARGAKGEDGRQGERGLPGRNAQDGAPGKQGESTRLVVVYKLTETAESPANPQGGHWDYETNTVTPPHDWSESAPNHESGYLWSSQAVFSSNGNQLQAWTQPIRLNGKDGGDGEDASDIEYVYKLTTNEKTIPDVPANDHNVDDYTGNWSDNPHGITETMRAEWMCSRLKKADGTWGNWIGPTLWSVWGSAGKDGDGVQYVYKQTETNSCDPITAVDNENLNEFIPPGWKDDPIGVTEEMPFEWVSKRKFDGTTQTWGNWSVPKLWASWGKKGDTGLSATFRYQAMVKDAEKPVIENKKAKEPGGEWSKLIPELEPGKTLWACQALVYEDGSVFCDESLPDEKRGWQGPWQITGADGEQGKTGPEPDYPAIVFKQSDERPAKPTGNDVKQPGDSWSPTVPADTKNGNWWGCWGQVTHQQSPEDEGEEDVVTSVEWGTPLPINGNMGNPCVLVSLQATCAQGTSGSWWKSLESKAIGVGNVTVSKATKFKGLVTITPAAGYEVKVTSANFNAGDVKSSNGSRIKSGDEHKCDGTSFMYAPHVYIENHSNGSKKSEITLVAFCQRDKNNDSLWAVNWDGSNLNSFTLTVFGTVNYTGT